MEHQFICCVFSTFMSFMYSYSSSELDLYMVRPKEDDGNVAGSIFFRLLKTTFGADTPPALLLLLLLLESRGRLFNNTDDDDEEDEVEDKLC